MTTPYEYDSLAVFIRERPLHYLWGLAADLVIFFSTIVLATMGIVGTFLVRNGRPIDWVGRLWCRLIVWICGIRVELIGAEKLETGKSYILISNHLSNFDIWCTLAVLQAEVRFVAKKELLKIPFFGQALRLSDHIVIDRQKPDEAIEIINRAAARSARGVCILFYAEGTRSQDGKIHAFKRGGVTLALRSQLPIVPMSVSGTRKFLPKGCAVIRPSGCVRIVLADPIETAGMDLEEREALNDRVRAEVQRGFIENL